MSEDEQHISQRQFTWWTSARCNRRAGIRELSTNLFHHLTNAFGTRMGELVGQSGTAKGKVGKNKVARIRGHHWPGPVVVVPRASGYRGLTLAFVLSSVLVLLRESVYATRVSRDDVGINDDGEGKGAFCVGNRRRRARGDRQHAERRRGCQRALDRRSDLGY